jgi:hypothetical protein
VPDGYKLDDAVAGEFSEIAKKMGLSQARAQTLVDFYVAKTQETFAQPFKAWNDLQKQWASEAESHPELRGKIVQVKQEMGRMLTSLGDPQLVSDFRKAMVLTGAGNHPAFVRVMAKLTAMFGEGKPVRAGGPSPHGQREPGKAPTSAAAALYPNLPSSG